MAATGRGVVEQGRVQCDSARIAGHFAMPTETSRVARAAPIQRGRSIERVRVADLPTSLGSPEPEVSGRWVTAVAVTSPRPYRPGLCVRSHAARAQRINVEKLGGLPCINKPIRKIFAVNHSAIPTDPIPMAIDRQICHQGGGVSVDIRKSIANVFTGGTKLATVLSTELGSREIGTERP